MKRVHFLCFLELTVSATIQFLHNFGFIKGLEKDEITTVKKCWKADVSSVDPSNSITADEVLTLETSVSFSIVSRW